MKQFRLLILLLTLVFQVQGFADSSTDKDSSSNNEVIDCQQFLDMEAYNLFGKDNYELSLDADRLDNLHTDVTNLIQTGHIYEDNRFRSDEGTKCVHLAEELLIKKVQPFLNMIKAINFVSLPRLF